MTDIAIRFDRVSKRYRLDGHFSLRDALARLARAGTRKPHAAPEEFWALREVSFDVSRGETLGLIGRNGAGKSTILKLLSRVTVPTRGTFVANGKIGALIEVGAGFHPDLTGRENVYLNAAIMGMRAAEIEEKFDRIVAFSEIEKFLDTPIKYYSSGMVVRLGFAVAAHIDPEILLIDEVLAVGDAAFQAKCLDKIGELKEQRKTIILVSHNMASVLKHSSRVLWIDHGTVRAYGEPQRIIDEYLMSVQTKSTGGDVEPEGDRSIRITDVVVRDAAGRPGGTIEHGRPATIEVAYEVNGPVGNPVVAISVHDVRGFTLGGLTTRLDGFKVDTSRPHGLTRLVLTPVLFTRGAYSITVAIHDEHLHRYLDFRSAAATLTVEGPSVTSRDVTGHVLYPHRWEGDELR